MKRLVLPNPIGGSAIVRDYLHEKPAASAFFSGPPLRLATYQEKLNEVRERFGEPERARAAAALKPTSERARERLDRFVREGGAMVTTGQQAGLLTGPLYTVYKALTAVALARHLEENLGTLVLPVFWVASDDHDWAEVNHTYVLDHRNRARRFELSGTDERPLPMSVRTLEGDLESFCDNVVETIAPKQHTADLVERIIGPYRVPGRTVAEAFGMAMEAILGPYDVCIADSADPRLKAAAVPVLRRALEKPGEEEAALTARTAEITAAGYAAQVAVMPGGTNVFRLGKAGRERIYARGDGYVVREGRERFDRETLLGELDAAPERFSPNVFLRPVVESWVYPTLAYVGGPGEIAYFGQAGALFPAHGMRAPVVVPRFSGLALEPKVERLLDSIGLSLDDARESRERLVERLARREVPPAVTDALSAVRDHLAVDYEELLDRAAEVDPTLAHALGAVRNRSLTLNRRAERAIIRAIKRSDRISIEQLDRILDTVRPLGAPQDRVLNVLSFVATFGTHFFKEVERAIQEDWQFPT